jgi:hypothetical protein
MARTNKGKVFSYRSASSGKFVRDQQTHYHTKSAIVGRYAQRVHTVIADRPFRGHQTALARVRVEEWESAVELADERRWADGFARTPDVLAALAAEARAERRAGRTKLLDPDTL